MGWSQININIRTKVSQNWTCTDQNLINTPFSQLCNEKDIKIRYITGVLKHPNMHTYLILVEIRGQV